MSLVTAAEEALAFVGVPTQWLPEIESGLEIIADSACARDAEAAWELNAETPSEGEAGLEATGVLTTGSETDRGGLKVLCTNLLCVLQPILKQN